MVRTTDDGTEGPRVRAGAVRGEDPARAAAGDREQSEALTHTPLFHAEHADRYERQRIIAHYQEVTGANLIVVLDQIGYANMTVLEDLLVDCAPAKDLHLLLASPGGDGETALRMVRSMQERCHELTVIVPDMAKSAATILCLGAHHILMGPGGDLGPIDPQMVTADENGQPVQFSSAKEIVAAVQEAEKRITENPASFTLYASLLSTVDMLAVEQARSALSRSDSLMAESLKAQGDRTDDDVKSLVASLHDPLIDTPTSHAAVFCADDGLRFGLPVVKADTTGEQWRLIWNLWTRYFAMGCWPAGTKSVYEGVRASRVV